MHAGTSSFVCRSISMGQEMTKTLRKTDGKLSNRRGAAKRKVGSKKSRTIDKRITPLGREIMQGLREAIAYERGEGTAQVVREPRPVSARMVDAHPAPALKAESIIALRTSLELSQAVFAKALNANVGTVRAWEQGSRMPSGPTLRLLEIAREHPHIVLERVKVKR